MTPLKGGGQCHHKVLIVGGGSGGITVASQLLRASPGLDVAILEPAAVHEYQSGWILAGAVWIQDRATAFEPEAQRVITEAGETLCYDVLVVAMGLQLNWSQIKGLPEALGSHGIVSNYSHAHITATWETIRSFQGGTSLFTHPATPIKCGGAPQKVMYLADEIFLVDPTLERWSMYLVEARLFPWVYWHRVLKGRLHESRFLKPFATLVRWFGLALKES